MGDGVYFLLSTAYVCGVLHHGVSSCIMWYLINFYTHRWTRYVLHTVHFCLITLIILFCYGNIARIRALWQPAPMATASVKTTVIDSTKAADAAGVRVRLTATHAYAHGPLPRLGHFLWMLITQGRAVKKISYSGRCLKVAL